LNVVCAGVLAHMRASVGGDQDCGKVGAEAPAQVRDRLFPDLELRPVQNSALSGDR